jgi:hypothetical protein
LQNFASENLVRGLHIRQPRAEQKIRQGREKTIRQARAKWNPTIARVQKTRSVDDVRLTGDNRLKQIIVLIRVEFEVGVLNQNHVALRVMQAKPNRRALAQVDRHRVCTDHRRVLLAVLLDDVRARVRRAVVGDDDFHFDIANVDAHNAFDQFANRHFFVVDRNEDR